MAVPRKRTTGNELSNWLSVCAMLFLIPSFVFAFVSRLMSWPGSESRQYRSLIIVLFTFLCA